MLSNSSSTGLTGVKVLPYTVNYMRKLYMKDFVHWLLPQLPQVTEEYQTNDKSNFTGDSLYIQKDLRLRDAVFLPRWVTMHQ